MKVEIRSAGRSIPIEEFQRVFSYNPETGIFIRLLKIKGSRPAGSVATHTRHGRLTIKLREYLFEASHVAWLLYYGKWPSHQVDHKDRDPLNNRISNLRDIPRVKNMMNQTVRKHNQSGFKGVTKHPQQSGYWVRISADGYRYQLGLYPTAELAAGAYRIAAAAMHGEYSGV